MTLAPTQKNEADRLERLRELFVLDSAPEPTFDRIAKLASEVCGVPIALMSLIDAERQWFKAAFGIEGVSETPRDIAFCAHAILDDGVLEVPDATLDARFATNPMVVGDPAIRFYAGAPLILPGGERIGTLCVIDRQPRSLNATQAMLLRSLAAIATSALLMRRELITRALSVRTENEHALRASEEFLARTGAVAGVGGWELECKTGKLTWSEQTRRIHEVHPDYVPTLETAIDFYPPESRAVIQAAVHQGMQKGTPWDLEVPFVTGAGRSIWVRSVGEVVFDGKTPTRLVGAFQDITGRKQLEQDLSRQAATLRSVTESIPALVAVVGSDGRYRFVNSGFERWCGASRDNVIGKTMSEVLGRSEYERSRPWIERVLSGESVTFEKEYGGRNVVRHMSINYFPLWLQSGEVDGFVTVAQDISQHRDEEIRLTLLTQLDALTGLLNRAGFEAYLQRQMVIDRGESLAVLYVDLDRFKPVNDTHGHPIGDRVLQQFAQRLQHAVRPTDGVARLGGDEFAIVLPGVRELANADHVARKVVAAAQQPFELGSITVNIGASVGVAWGTGDSEGWQGLVARADAMLYRAKQGGRGRSSVEASA